MACTRNTQTNVQLDPHNAILEALLRHEHGSPRSNNHTHHICDVAAILLDSRSVALSGAKRMQGLSDLILVSSSSLIICTCNSSGGTRHGWRMRWR